MPLKFRKREYPLWAHRALRHALINSGERRSAARDDVEAANCQLPRRFAKEAVHGMMEEDDADAALVPKDEGSSRDLAGGEEENNGEGEPEEMPYNTFSKLMEFAVSDKKSDNFLPIAGNIYRYWALGLGGLCNRASRKKKNFFNHFTQEIGLLLVFCIQLLAPVACITYAIYDIEWENFSVGLDSWTYVYGSRRHGISNLLKHIVAVLLLFCFTLNGANVVYNEKVASMKIAAAIKHSGESFQKDINTLWMHIGPMMNCMLVLECCIIVYLLFIIAESPMDVVMNALAVTFLYNLDDIGGDFGFLGDEHWDAEAFGKHYYVVADEGLATEIIMPEGEEVDPDDFHEHPHSSNYVHFSYKIAVPIMYLLTAALPLAYIFIGGLHEVPGFEERAIEALQKQVQALQHLQQ